MALRQYNIYNFLLGILVFLCTTSCTDENLESLEQGNNGLIEVKLGISAPTPANIVASRVSDDAVLNMFVFVFNSSGRLVFKQYYDTNALNNPDDTKQSSTTAQNTNYVTAIVPVGRAYIYGIANINSEVYGNLYDRLNAITNKDELVDMEIDILESAMNLTRIGQTYLMAGTCTDNENVDYYTVTKGTTNIRHLKLKWIDSQITFNFNAAENCSEFRATKWYCVNAPASSMLLEKKATGNTYDNWDASNDAVGFYSTYEKPQTIENNQFIFYMPENRKLAKNKITNYNQRELETLENKLAHVNNPGSPRTYVNAPDNATYVVVHGKFEGKTSNGISETNSYNNANATADVTYVIHLGNSDDDPADFFSNRNTKYTYNVTVKGIDSIVIEVESSDQETPTENVPGATGEVTFTGESQTYILDAHYETVLLKFNVKSLVNKYKLAQNITGENKFQCIVSTPYTNMAGCDKTQDMAWVKFIKNSNASEILARYDRNTKYLTANELLSQLEYAVEEYIEYNKDVENEDDYKIPTGSIFNSNGDVTYTCFVDEFYYDEADLPIKKTSLPDQANIWKSFVNQPNRKLYLVCSTSNSKDGESTIISSEYIFSQRSIMTFYTTEPSTGTVIAYGVETLNETGMLDWGTTPYQTRSNCSSTKDGWTNFKHLVNSLDWNNVNHNSNGYISVEKNKSIQNGSAYLQGMNENYQKAYIACMQRNRNEAGGTSVSDSDLKWYLPSIEQLQAFYIGESVLDDAKLYHYPTVDGTTIGRPGLSNRKLVYKHFASSSYKPNQNSSQNYQFYILWAEEGTSISTIKERYDWNDDSWDNGQDAWKNYNYHYRCVRYLGADNSVSTTSPYNNFVEISPPNNGNQIITYSLLNENVIDRSAAANGDLGAHIYDENQNELWKKGIEISSKNIETDGINTLEDMDNLCNKSFNQGDGYAWRIPNLRELTLMRQMQVNNIATLCRTKFKYDFRTSWWVGGTTQNIQMQGLGSKIRCVRDIK